MPVVNGLLHDGTLTPDRRYRTASQQINWDSGDDTARLDADVALTRTPAGPSSWTRTITPYGTSALNQAALAGGDARVGRIRFTSSATHTTERFWQPIKGAHSADSEIRSLWYDRWGVAGGNAGGQLGHVHRFQLHPTTGRPWGYIVWHDITLNLESYFNFDSWYADSGFGSSTSGMVQGSAATPNTGGGSLELSGMRKIIAISASSKVGTTVTINLPYGHAVAVGDSCDIATTEIIESLTVTAISATTATFTSGTSVTNPIYVGGRGTLRDYRSMPFWVASRLEGVTLRAKAWPSSMDEPSWEDPAYAAKWTDATSNTNAPAAGVVGQACIYNGHLGNLTSSFTEWGEVNWRSLD